MSLITLGIGIAKSGILSSGKIGVDDSVEDAIKQVEATVGLTKDVRDAWCLFDGRYDGQRKCALGDCGLKSYIENATKSHYTWDSGHYGKMCQMYAERIEDCLNLALTDWRGSPKALLGGITETIKKPYFLIGIGFVVMFVMMVLMMKRR